MARPWISLLLLSLVLLFIEAEEGEKVIEPCPKNNACLLFSRGTVTNHLGTMNNSETTGYLWEADSTCAQNYQRNGFMAGLWIKPITTRKWKFVLTTSEHEMHEPEKKPSRHKITFDFGNAKISFIDNKKKEKLEAQFYFRKGMKWLDTVHEARIVKEFTSLPGPPEDPYLFKYVRYESEIESSEKKMISYFGVDAVKMSARGTSEMNDRRFNETLVKLTKCETSELNTIDNEKNGKIALKDGIMVDCSSNLWYRKPDGDWKELTSMSCHEGSWEGNYTRRTKVEKTEAPEETETEESATKATNGTVKRAVRASDDQDATPVTPTEEATDEYVYEEPKLFDLTGMDVACSPDQPPASAMSAGVKIAIGFGVFFLLLIIAGAGIAVFLVWRSKKAAAGPNDTFRGGSDSKAQTPKESKKSDRTGSVAEIGGGMSPAGTPNTPK